MTAPRAFTNYTLEFELQGLPKMSNQLLRGHWASKTGHARKWKFAVASKCAKLVKPPQPLTSAVLCLTRCSSREPDFDGLVSSFKHVIDGLVEARILAGDKMSVIGQPRYVWEKAPLRMGKIRVRVEETPLTKAKA